MKYQPKRSRAKFSEGAPEYVLACYDNGGKTCDRYTVLFGGTLWDPNMGRKVQFLGMSGAPTHPQGFSQWGELNAFDRSGCGKHVRWLDLPENIRAHVIARATSE